MNHQTTNPTLTAILSVLALTACAGGDHHHSGGHNESAIGELRLYLEAGGSGELNVYRRIAELYGKTGDAMNALLMVETALAYNSSDPDLIEKKHSYYYSVTEEKLLSVRDKVASYFDTSYCVKKAMSLLNATTDDQEMIDWATHLSKLAMIMKPTENGVRLIQARCLLRKGDRDAGITILEDIREAKKGSGDEEDAWYSATKILGQLYLEELNRPDLAVGAFNDYKLSSKSGADTLYKLGLAYEQLGEPKRAAKYFEQVTAYDSHPLAPDARDALARVRA